MSKKKSSQSTSTTIDPRLMAMYQDVYDRAETQADKKFQGYRGDRLAAFDDTQALAQQQVQRNFSDAFGNNARGALYDNLNSEFQPVAARSVLDRDVQNYMNPFTENVIDATFNRLDKEYKKQSQANRDRALQQGAFGNDRRFVQDAVLQSENLDRKQAAAANLYNQAYGQGMNLLRGDIGLATNADLANQRGSMDFMDANSRLAGMALADQTSQLNALAGVGDARQRFAQAGLDQNVANFYEEQNFPIQGINLLNSVLGTMPMQSTTTSTGTPGGGGAAGALGGAAAGAGIASALSLTNPMTAVLAGGLLGGF
jgi:hypothetical protein